MATAIATTATAPLRPVKRLPLLTAGAITAALALHLAATYGLRQAALLGLGLLLGVTLYHAAFGFTSAFRVLLSDGRTVGLRAQMVMLALGCLLFFPALGLAAQFGLDLRGNVSPVGVSLLVGALVFGVGMQLGGGCASGTLYTAGGGNARMLVVLAFFVVGSLVGTAHTGFWFALPALPPLSAATPERWAGGLALHLALFLAIAAGAAWIERRRHGGLVPIATTNDGRTMTLATRLVRGPWPLLWGAVALAVLNFATLLLAGRPWGVTSAFALWGAKLATGLGVDVASWPHWSSPQAAASLAAPVLADVTSVMDLGIVLGALAASILAGRFRPSLAIPARSLLAAVVGGLLLGYGARLAYGCNIGAYFSGVVSGSLHGWVWLAAALAGNALGVRLRPVFGLAVERTARQTGC